MAVPSSAVRMRCDSTLSMPSLAGMARNTVYAGGWTAVSNTRCAGVPTGAKYPKGLTNPTPSATRRACWW